MLFFLYFPVFSHPALRGLQSTGNEVTAIKWPRETSLTVGDRFSPFLFLLFSFFRVYLASLDAATKARQNVRRPSWGMLHCGRDNRQVPIGRDRSWLQFCEFLLDAMLLSDSDSGGSCYAVQCVTMLSILRFIASGTAVIRCETCFVGTRRDESFQIELVYSASYHLFLIAFTW